MQISSTNDLLPGHYFNESVWYAFNQFTQSDSSSGVGCDFYSNSSDTGDLGAIMNVYYRNTSSLELQQSWWSFRTNAGWNCTHKSLRSNPSFLALLTHILPSWPNRRRNFNRLWHTHQRQ